MQTKTGKRRQNKSYTIENYFRSSVANCTDTRAGGMPITIGTAEK